MENPILYSLASVIIVSLISFIGAISLAINKKKIHKFIIYLVSFSVGALFGDAFLHLLPQAVKEFGFGLRIGLYVLSGILLFFIIEKFVHWRHCHMEGKGHHHSFAIMNLMGDGLHNLIDGLIIAASYLIDIRLGIATTVAIILHEIPQEIGDFGVLLHGGFTVRKALFYNFIIGATAILGTLLGLLLNNYFEHLTKFLIPFTVGGFIYIAGTDLIPELHKEVGFRKSLLQFFMLSLGILIMVGLLFIE